MKLIYEAITNNNHFYRKDVILPYELQKAMAAEAEGTRIAKAKIIEAEGEIKTAENLRDASKVMMEHPQTILVIDIFYIFLY